MYAKTNRITCCPETFQKTGGQREPECIGEGKKKPVKRKKGSGKKGNMSLSFRFLLAFYIFHIPAFRFLLTANC